MKVLGLGGEREQSDCREGDSASSRRVPKVDKPVADRIQYRKRRVGRLRTAVLLSE